MFSQGGESFFGGGMKFHVEQALNVVATVTGGFAALLDEHGRVLNSVTLMDEESTRKELELASGLVDRQGKRGTLVASLDVEGAQAFILPIGGYFLVAGNHDRKKKDQTLKRHFLEALPLIALVAGGEAVMFDRNGLRLASVGPDGRDFRGAGEYTALGLEAMQSRRPILGPSLLEKGAQAVRIPITDHFGIGFNNVLAVKQKKVLVTSARCEYPRYTFDGIIGESRAISDCVKQAYQVANSHSTVLLCGETGTGKEIFAQSIHNASSRSGSPFVAINCGAIPSSLIESHLFGYESGAFTGAKKDGQKGVFEQAIGGTLFLDEISEMEIGSQSRLLRVLQEREVVRVGGGRRIPVDVKVIASTNKNLRQLVASGTFREDLFYRLNVVELDIPSLRERVEDIPMLVRYFIKQFRENFGTYVKDISAEAILCLQQYSWPGNVRELQNCIERTINLITHEVIQVQDLPPLISEYPSGDKITAKKLEPALPLIKASRLAERENIIRALKEFGNNRRLSAGHLGISTTTLWRKMKNLGID